MGLRFPTLKGERKACLSHVGAPPFSGTSYPGSYSLWRCSIPGSIFDEDDAPVEAPIKVSASALRTLSNCEFQYYGTYILKYREPLNGNLFFGSRFDETLNYNYGNKKTSGKDLPKGDLQDFFRATWDAQKDQVEGWEDAKPDEMKEVGTNGIEVFHKEVLPSVQPVEVQPKLSMTFKNQNVVLTGYPDVLEGNSQIIDNKTSGKTQTETYIKQAIQPPVYSILTSAESTQPQEVRYDILVKTKKPKVQQLKTVITHADRQATLKYISNSIEAIRSMTDRKNFRPTAFFRGGWECGYCPVANLCRETWGLNIPESKIKKSAPPLPTKVLAEIDEAKKGLTGQKALDVIETAVKKAKIVDDDAVRNILV